MSDFAPELQPYTKPGKFRFWCQEVLPLVYDDSLSYYELLNKVIVYVNNLIQDNSATVSNVEALLTAFEQLQEYVNEFVDNLDITAEVEAKIDAMVDNGGLLAVMTPYIDTQINEIENTLNTTIQEAFNEQDDYNAATRTIVNSAISEQTQYNTQTRNMVQNTYSGPRVAETASDMTDTSLIYVYTGSETGYLNGYWYYNDGSSWTAGGVYNATPIETDTTFTVSGEPADALATGEYFNALSEGVPFDLKWWCEWEIGALHSITGAEISSTTRIRTKFINIQNFSSLEISVNSGYKYMMYCYDSVYHYLADDSVYSWQTSNTTKTLGDNVKFVRLLVATTSDGEASLNFASEVFLLGTPVTQSNANTMRDDIITLESDVSDLKEDLNKISQVVYKTDISATTGLIPFHAEDGDSITIKTKDGSNFIGGDQLRFYDENGTYINYYSTTPYTTNYRTVTYGLGTVAYYIGITQVASSVIEYEVENSSNAYNLEQTIEDAQTDISELQTQAENIKNDLYEQTVILTDNSMRPFPIANGTAIVITTTDGTTLPEENPYLRCYDADSTYLQQFACSSAYGTARTVTISAGNVAYVKMYTTPSKPIKVYIPDNSKLIPKVNEIANIVGQDVIIVDASGSGDYASFTEAIYETVDDGIDVYVKPGTYNIVSEYVTLFGQEAVDSMADANTSIFNGFQYGVRLRNRKVKFAPGAHIICDWTGHTVNGTHRFSALGIDYDVEIVGLDLDCTATFYAIHDDYGIASPYTVKYENCRVVGHSIYNANCIGGGCKKYSRHILKNCYFDNNLTDSATVRYHNTNADGAEPEIYVSNCYFNNWFTPRYYGTQTSKMRVYVNNCYARSIHKLAESSSYTTDNVELYKWCNTETNPVT